MAARSASSVAGAAGSSATVARSVARFTWALTTPGTFASARSTRRTHEAQVMPVMGRTVIGLAGGAVAMRHSNRVCGRWVGHGYVVYGPGCVVVPGGGRPPA